MHHGVTTIVSGEHSGQFLVSYVVPAVSLVAEGISWLKAQRQVTGASRRRFLRLTSDTTVKAVYFEDSAALTGLLPAAAGIALSQLTVPELRDGPASIAIGLLLLVVATVLARSNVSLLVGRAEPRRMHNLIADDLASTPVVTAVPTLLTMQLGPGVILVAAKVDFHDEVTGAEIEEASDEAERRLRARLLRDPVRVPGPDARQGRPLPPRRRSGHIGSRPWCAGDQERCPRSDATGGAPANWT
ncbi:cation transporter [Actinoplanes sp. NPDC049599]|uniref:cation transporter n=1 Tax=Actinoplanes sp. NPDC049599 TaxID=3363903 RepID=UPI003795B4CC